jgi:tRNA pseudouridine38-40 synthase
MPVIRLTLAYDGSAFCGWQVQPNQRTVQTTVEKAIRKVTGETVQVLSAGRTDSGVHALGQVASFTTQATIPGPSWRFALQSALPDDITVLDSRLAPDTFHATFSARRKCYRYLIYNGTAPLPFFRKFLHHHRGPLDLAPMREAAAMLVGRHDFRSFETDWPNKATSVRTIESLRIGRAKLWSLWQPTSLLPVPSQPLCDEPETSNGERDDGEIVVLEITADGFLYNMVRTIVGTLIPIGRHTWPAESMRDILNAQSRRVAGNTAPACGLYLVWVDYGDDDPKDTAVTNSGEPTL